jgi:hypothetical protein
MVNKAGVELNDNLRILWVKSFDSILTGSKTVPPLSATVSRRESKSNFLAEGPNSVRDPNENGLRHGQ